MEVVMKNSFGAASILKVRDRNYQIFRLECLDRAGVANTSKIPYSIRILLENLLRFEEAFPRLAGRHSALTDLCHQ